MIRVTEHTARRDLGACVGCGTPVRTAERYRSLVAIAAETFDRGFVRMLAHDFCATGEGWELRDDRRARDPGDPLCAYVREHYGLMVERGSRVVAGGKPGTVRGATHHVWVRLDGERHPGPWHPGDIQLREN
jgi:hypothetical protein